MNYLLYQNNLRLFPRNEGKIKSYESCCDLRAWSHDVSAQDQYLREWMKADTPICIIQTTTLISFLRIMTCKSRRRATPRCHPDCKSKELLESICNSCQAMRKCLQQDTDLEKYFVEEELESSHWPCDRCLEALKSIKMFWKILIDKLFNLNFTKFKRFDSSREPVMGGVRSVAKVWEAEIQQQALIIKNMTPVLSKASNLLGRSESSTAKLLGSDKCRSKHSDHTSMISSKSYTFKQRGSKDRRKISKSTSTRIKTNDVGCETCFIKENEEEILTYKNNLEMQAKSHVQAEEIEMLRKENDALKIVLDKVYKSCPWKAAFYIPNDKENSQTGKVVPQKFAPSIKKCSPAKKVDSEMIITMKNGKDESFRHVSLLKVLHKTNDPIILQDATDYKPCSRKEDPLKILNKVQNTFGAIVRREMSIVHDRKYRPTMTDVDAAFYKFNTIKSDPSFSTSTSSGSDFKSTQDFMDKTCVRVSNVI